MVLPWQMASLPTDLQMGPKGVQAASVSSSGTCHAGPKQAGRPHGVVLGAFSGLWVVGLDEPPQPVGLCPVSSLAVGAL